MGPLAGRTVTRTRYRRTRVEVGGGLESMFATHQLGALSPDAAGVVELCLSPDFEGQTGKFFVHTRPTDPPRASLDPANAERLWSTCASLAGVPEAW